jgi:hypothetical protein
MNIKFLIDAVHPPGVEKNQGDKDINRSLLREPEAELKSANSNVIQLVDQQDTESIRTDEPYGEAG